MLTWWSLQIPLPPLLCPSVSMLVCSLCWPMWSSSDHRPVSIRLIWSIWSTFTCQTTSLPLRLTPAWLFLAVFTAQVPVFVDNHGTWYFFHLYMFCCWYTSSVSSLLFRVFMSMFTGNNKIKVCLYFFSFLFSSVLNWIPGISRDAFVIRMPLKIAFDSTSVSFCIRRRVAARTIFKT